MKKIITSNEVIREVFFLITILLITFQVNAQSFSQSTLQGVSVSNPTSLQFGPDGNLYVAQQDGAIKIFTVNKVSSNNYNATSTETIFLVKQIPNHYDNGTARPYNINTNKRQVTGLYVSGTASAPIIYVASSDDAVGAGEYGDVNLCTNSGIISKLYKQSGVWKKMDLVRGLPRSEENHGPNGIQIYNNKLFLIIGGFTNAGSPSNAWTYICEYAFSSAMVSVDLTAIESMSTKMDVTGNHPYKYDMPTLDDPTRANNPDGSDINDPWGGNDGLNQAKVTASSPVQLFATGFRNAYDILITKTPGRANKMYTIDNGPNGGWGGWPVNEGPSGNATNQYDTNETGSFVVSNNDGLELIGDLTTYDPSVDIYYAGHANPIRSNPAGAGLYSDDGTNRGWRNDNSNPNLPLPSDWPPVPLSMANPEEGDYRDPGSATDKSLITFSNSTNGLCEYTASGSMQGDLLAAGYDGKIYRIRLDNSGHVLNSIGTKRINQDPPFASGFGNKPLDIVAQGDSDIFPATIWVATWGSNIITVFEPQVITGCTGADSSSLDEDSDGFTNADEIDNGTDPCSGSSMPNDNDGDHISDLNDNDDDNDGISDTQDFFAIDPDNGLTTTIPTHYNLFNYDPGTGFYGLGFTGLMCNGVSDYQSLYDENNFVAGGAAGVFTIENVPAGDALDGNNTQHYSFQFGVKTSGEGTFTVHSGISPMYFDQDPQGNQSQGIFIGTGDQDNYLKVVLVANGGIGGLEVVYENNGVSTSNQYALPGGIPINSISFYITVDPSSSKAYIQYSIAGGTPVSLGGPITLSGPLVNAITNNSKAMAVGIIATSKGASPFHATWDYIEVYTGSILSIDKWHDGTLSENIHLYPNPAKDKLMMNVGSGKNTNYKVRLYNNLVEVLYEEKLKWVTGQSDNEMNISKLAPGIYYLQFVSEDDKHSVTIKFIKE